MEGQPAARRGSNVDHFRSMDSAFAPRASYRFSDDQGQFHDAMSHFDRNGEHSDFDFAQDMFGEGDYRQDQFDASPHEYSSAATGLPDNWQYTEPKPSDFSMGQQFGTLSMPRSAQQDILNSRNTRARERFGQVTPPDDYANEPFEAPPYKRTHLSQSEEEENAKLGRAQRARNAANKRHSKSKKANNEGQKIVNGGEGGEGGPGSSESRSVAEQREKNRVAAAKCRAKKKSHSEILKEESRCRTSVNSELKMEERQLKEQRAMLRNHLLQHEPGRCNCTAIHNFNMVAAQNFAFGLGSMGPPRVSSPSQDSTQSPLSDESRRMSLATGQEAPRPGHMGTSSGPQSFSGPWNYPFSQGTALEAVDGRGLPRISESFDDNPMNRSPHFGDFSGGQS